jgi:hypothetical protein
MDNNSTKLTSIKAKTDNLPASPAATGDIPSASSIAAAVWGATTRTLSSIADSAGVTTLLSRIASALTITAGKVDVNDKTGFALTTGERTAIANEVEAQIIDDTDSEKVLKAITDKIAAANPSLEDLTLAAIAAAVRTELATELARMDAAVTSRLSAAGYTAPDNANIALIKAKTDNLPADPASNTQVNTRLAASAYTAPDNTDIAAIKAKTDNLPASPAATGDIPTANITAIKAKTDQLSFTGAGVDAVIDYGAMDTGAIAAALLDEQTADHAGPGTIGEKLNLAGSFVLPVMQGRAWSVTAQQGRIVEVIRGTEPIIIPFDLGADYSGWTTEFGAKASASDSSFTIGPVAGAWIDETKGTGTITLFGIDIEAVKLSAEIDLLKDAKRLPGLRFTLKFIDGVFS